MKNGELLKKLEDFLSDLVEHRDLWKNSRGRSHGTTRILVVNNQEHLENQKKTLNQNFGGLEKYLEALLPGRGLMGNSFGTRNIWLTAIGDLQDLDKGKSMEFFISHLNQAVGKLREMPPYEEILETHTTTQKTSLSKISKYEKVLSVFQGFNPCFNYLKSKGKYQINSEDDVKDLIYVMLRSSFENVEWEENIPKAAGKGHRIDLVVKDCKTLVESKFVRDSNHAKNITVEINDDFVAYTTSGLEGFVVFIYDPQKLIIDPEKLSHFYREQTSQYKFIDVRVVN